MTKVGWIRNVSSQCCQTCNGTVFPANTPVSTTYLGDECQTVKTEVCRIRPGRLTASIEQEFSHRNCCLGHSKSIDERRKYF